MQFGLIGKRLIYRTASGSVREHNALKLHKYRPESSIDFVGRPTVDSRTSL
jgi:hypothetical protein